jgi:hypothetical protein
MASERAKIDTIMVKTIWMARADPTSVVGSLFERITGRPSFNLSRLDFAKLLDDPNQLAEAGGF